MSIQLSLQLIETGYCAESKGVLLVCARVCGAGDTKLVFYMCIS